MTEVSEFVVVSVQDGQVVAVSKPDFEPPATLIVNYGSDTKVMDYVGMVWEVEIR